MMEMQRAGYLSRIWGSWTRQMRLPRTKRIAAVLLVAGLVAACSTNPITGRQQFIMISPQQGAQMGLQAYQQIKQEKKVLPTSSAEYKRINGITQKLIASNPLPNFDWEVSVFDDDSANAFALPGGKMGVHTGLTKVAETDAQLAAVIGHELAHAVSRHGEERVSQQMALNMGLTLGAVALGASGNQNAGLWVGLLSQAATLGVVLPYSRLHESEADEIGLFYMARAGYDPREAITLWENMGRNSRGAPPEFLSTHPAAGTRIQRLQQAMPRALQLYQAAGGRV